MSPNLIQVNEKSHYCLKHLLKTLESISNRWFIDLQEPNCVVDTHRPGVQFAVTIVLYLTHTRRVNAENCPRFPKYFPLSNLLPPCWTPGRWNRHLPFPLHLLPDVATGGLLTTGGSYWKPSDHVSARPTLCYSLPARNSGPSHWNKASSGVKVKSRSSQVQSATLKLVTVRHFVDFSCTNP